MTAQHALSLTGHDARTMIGPFSVGQLGVAVLLGVSGLLASAASGSPSSWLARRLQRVYPAYWLVMLLSFALVYATGYKTFTVSQFVSQMAGTGLFTHPGSLVNVPTWFISLLLTCYVVGLRFASRSRRVDGADGYVGDCVCSPREVEIRGPGGTS